VSDAATVTPLAGLLPGRERVLPGVKEKFPEEPEEGRDHRRRRRRPLSSRSKPPHAR
jgi:hypothetical protein